MKNQDGAVVGCTALCIETGEVVYFKARATVLATGGAGRIYQSTTNAHINTGDENCRHNNPLAGVPVQDRKCGIRSRYRRCRRSGNRRLPW